MKTRTYKLNLRGISIEQYKENPIVLSDWQYDLEHIIGTARILPGKMQVEVTYIDDEPAYAHAIGDSVSSYNYEQPTLVALAVIPIIDENPELLEKAA